MLWALLILTAAGVALLALGLWPRRVGDEPRCGKCGFDLSGIELDSHGVPCPECGTQLADPGGVVIGKEVRRPRMAIAGGVMVMPILAFLTMGSNWTAWNTSKPVAILKLDARFGSVSVRDAAMDEISLRWQGNKLTQSEKQGLVSLAARSVTSSGVPDPVWLEIVGVGMADGIIGSEDLDRLNNRMAEIGRDAMDLLEARTAFCTMHLGFESGPLTRGPTLGFPDEIFNSETPLGLPRDNGLAVLHALKEMRLEGEPVALQDLSSYYKVAFRETKQEEIWSAETENHVSYRTPMQNAPRELEPAQWGGSFENYPETMTAGIRHIDLPPGEHEVQTTWTVYVGFSRSNAGGAWGGTGRPAVFGPFEVQKTLTFHHFTEASQIYTPMPSEQSTDAAETFRARYSFESLHMTGQRSEDISSSNFSSDYTFAELIVTDTDPDADDQFRPYFAGHFELEIGSSRFPLVDLPPRLDSEHPDRVLPADITSKWDFVTDARSRPLRVWVEFEDAKPMVCDVVFVPDFESPMVMQKFAAWAIEQGRPVEVLAEEIRWQDVPITWPD
ncbi:MAG: hypothetical protein ACF8Q5_05120 [Phycisphaerales bacterium JB040]